MKNVLIATHGKMASGIRYTAELVVGQAASVTTIDAYVNSEDDIEGQMREYFESRKGERIFVFTDIQGGSVNQKLIPYAKDPNVILITGVNLPVLIQVMLSGDDVTREEIRSYIEAARQELKMIELEAEAADTVKASGGAEKSSDGAGKPTDGTGQPSGGAKQSDGGVGQTSAAQENSKARITALRVDDRLIHGQVAMTWTKQLRVQGIVVANDEAANDPTQKMALQMAVPAGIKVLIRPVEDAIRVLNHPKAEKMRILVLTRTVKDALNIREHVGEIGFLNIGNAGRFDGISNSEKKMLSPTIMLTEEEIRCLEKLVGIDPAVCMQQVPNDVRKLVKDALDKIK